MREPYWFAGRFCFPLDWLVANGWVYESQREMAMDGMSKIGICHFKYDEVTKCLWEEDWKVEKVLPHLLETARLLGSGAVCDDTSGRWLEVLGEG